MRGFAAAQRAYDNMTPDDDEPDIDSIDDRFKYIDCPYCQERYDIDSTEECCGEPVQDHEPGVDWDAVKDYGDECRAEAQAEARADRMEDW